MKKINRRDYLLQMGAGAAGVMSSAPLNVLAESLKPSVRAETPQQTTDLLWIPTSSIPSNPKVTVIFGGLFGFFYNPRTGNCEVGSHRGDRKHRLMIAVWERPSPGTCNLFLSTENGSLRKPNQQVKIEIVGKSSDVNCYQVGPYSLETRNQLLPRDFRWLPDLDSNDFYPENYPKLTGKFGVKSLVRHGTLYTYQLSSSIFSRVDPPTPPPNPQDPVDVKDFYNVAQYMAAAIQPSGTEHVSLQIDSRQPVPLNKPGVTYQITILNHCYENEHSHVKCTFTPHDPLEEKRNDFHHVRKVIQFPANERRRYGLKLKDRAWSSPTFCLEGRREKRKDNTDEAPCMGSAFGKTKAMP